MDHLNHTKNANLAISEINELRKLDFYEDSEP